jgi:hypothetical protein
MRHAERTARQNGAPASAVEAQNRFVSRRAVLRTLGFAGVGLIAGCTPLRIVLHDYPEVFDDDRELTDRVLRAFVTTVIPGTDPETPHLTRAFFDPAYPFAPRTAYFAADLCRRSSRAFGHNAFHTLDPVRRSRIIVDGLRADATTRRLYGGAIFLTQVAVYAGIYDDSVGCELIEFQGSRGLLSPMAQRYPHPERFLACESTANGNAD